MFNRGGYSTVCVAALVIKQQHLLRPPLCEFMAALILFLIDYGQH